MKGAAGLLHGLAHRSSYGGGGWLQDEAPSVVIEGRLDEPEEKSHTVTGRAAQPRIETASLKVIFELGRDVLAAP